MTKNEIPTTQNENEVWANDLCGAYVGDEHTFCAHVGGDCPVHNPEFTI